MALEVMQASVSGGKKGKKEEMVETEIGTKVPKSVQDKWEASEGEALNAALLPAKKKLVTMSKSKPKLVDRLKKSYEAKEEE